MVTAAPRPDTELHATVIGTGLSVVAVHGWGADSRILEPFAVRLADEFAVWLPDLPGHGRTPHSGTGNGFNDHCADLLSAWIDDRGLHDAPIVAWAWGARVVVDLVAAGRINPHSLALVALPPPADVPDPCSGPLWRDHARYVRAIVRMMTAAPVSPEAERWLTSLMTSTSVAATGGSHAQPWRAPAGFQAPSGTIAVLGAGDRIGAPDAAAALIETWSATVEIWERSGHLPFLEEPDRFAARIRNWLHDIGYGEAR